MTSPLRQPHYIVWIDYGKDGIGSSDPTPDSNAGFDAAVDTYADARDAGYDAVMWVLMPKFMGMTDMTDAAEHLIANRCTQRNLPKPEWMK